MSLAHLTRGFFCRTVASFIAAVCAFTWILPPEIARAQTVPALLGLPAPGTMVRPGAEFVPMLLRGVALNPQNPLRFDFILDTGHTKFDETQTRAEADRLIKYFLAGLTTPADDLWVNLSPYEEERMIPDKLGQTGLGRDMLAQDYILKQLTASLMYPEDDLGQRFWDRVYARAQEEYGTIDIPVNTFNKVWILPETAEIFENGPAAYVTEARLKVMLDQDFRAMRENPVSQGHTSHVTGHEADEISQEMIREIILPELEREVNEGEHFAQLRQIYHTLILAKWYKETITNALTRYFVDQNKIAGVDLTDKTMRDQIYQMYVAAYHKGAFNMIRLEDDPVTRQPIPRKYFSGGLKWNIEPERTGTAAEADDPTGQHLKASAAGEVGQEPALTSDASGGGNDRSGTNPDRVDPASAAEKLPSFVMMETPVGMMPVSTDPVGQWLKLVAFYHAVVQIFKEERAIRRAIRTAPVQFRDDLRTLWLSRDVNARIAAAQELGKSRSGFVREAMEVMIELNIIPVPEANEPERELYTEVITSIAQIRETRLEEGWTNLRKRLMVLVGQPQARAAVPSAVAAAITLVAIGTAGLFGLPVSPESVGVAGTSLGAVPLLAGVMGFDVSGTLRWLVDFPRRRTNQGLLARDDIEGIRKLWDGDPVFQQRFARERLEPLLRDRNRRGLVKEILYALLETSTDPDTLRVVYNILRRDIINLGEMILPDEERKEHFIEGLVRDLLNSLNVAENSGRRAAAVHTLITEHFPPATEVDSKEREAVTLMHDLYETLNSAIDIKDPKVKGHLVFQVMGRLLGLWRRTPEHRDVQIRHFSEPVAVERVQGFNGRPYMAIRVESAGSGPGTFRDRFGRTFRLNSPTVSAGYDEKNAMGIIVPNRREDGYVAHYALIAPAEAEIEDLGVTENPVGGAADAGSSVTLSSIASGIAIAGLGVAAAVTLLAPNPALAASMSGVVTHLPTLSVLPDLGAWVFTAGFLTLGSFSRYAGLMGLQRLFRHLTRSAQDRRFNRAKARVRELFTEEQAFYLAYNRILDGSFSFEVLDQAFWDLMASSSEKPQVRRHAAEAIMRREGPEHSFSQLYQKTLDKIDPKGDQSRTALDLLPEAWRLSKAGVPYQVVYRDAGEHQVPGDKVIEVVLNEPLQGKPLVEAIRKSIPEEMRAETFRIISQEPDARRVPKGLGIVTQYSYRVHLQGNPITLRLDEPGHRVEPVFASFADSHPVAPSAASDPTPGGIAMDEMKLQRSGLAPEEFEIDPEVMQTLINGDFDGITPRIMTITPINSVLPLLGLNDPDAAPVRISRT